MCPDTVDLPPLSAAPGILLLQIRHIEPRPEANGQQPRPLVAVRPPLAHPPHGKPGLHARTDELETGCAQALITTVSPVASSSKCACVPPNCRVGCSSAR